MHKRKEQAPSLRVLATFTHTEKGVNSYGFERSIDQQPSFLDQGCQAAAATACVQQNMPEQQI